MSALWEGRASVSTSSFRTAMALHGSGRRFAGASRCERPQWHTCEVRQRVGCPRLEGTLPPAPGRERRHPGARPGMTANEGERFFFGNHMPLGGV